jgi:hypothetical protein
MAVPLTTIDRTTLTWVGTVTSIDPGRYFADSQ